MRKLSFTLPCCLLFSVLAAGLEADALTVGGQVKTSTDFPLVVDGQAAQVVVDKSDAEVVQVAAGLFAGDVQRVSGVTLSVANAVAGKAPVIVAGTLGHSALVDQLAAAGKLKDLAKLKGGWEATLWQVVRNPFPGVERALVIAGSDRRGTAYGLMDLSEKIGVSPWVWWADVPAAHHATLVIQVPAPETDAPAVKYRGIFINDEDWGLNQWASKTFDPEFKNIGPKTYDKVFELLLRLRLNYIWPAMHACTVEFGSQPENIALADKYGIVAGASHCEAMLYNNVHWDRKIKGPWNYSTNRDAIHSAWEDNVKARSTEEAVWTIGIRGIHDAPMETPPGDTAGKLTLLTTILKDQRALLDQYVTKRYGPVAQCFVPYKEVLPVYDAGLQVPDDVTIVWVDDNFGYIRRLGAPADRNRSGGAGVYWHISYYGNPHSYTWINTTPPALIWEELYKAWENGAGRLWVLNVGDIKPMEIGMDYYSKLAWNPEAMGADSQPRFLRSFAAQHFGEKLAQPIADLLGEFYRLGTIRKPELMERAWALSLPDPVAAQLRSDYQNLLQKEEKLSALIPTGSQDAYFELIGFPARVLGGCGLLFMADREGQLGKDTKASDEIAQQKAFLEKQVDQYNNATAGGKWKYMMPGLVTGKYLSKWSSQVRWPWGEKGGADGSAATPSSPSEAAPQPQPAPARIWRDAASANRQVASRTARWVSVPGLGQTSRAMALEPASLSSSWKEGDPNAPTLEFDFQGSSAAGDVLIDFLPTFRIYPGLQLRVAVTVDNQVPVLVEIPGSNGKEDERGPNRRDGIQNNYVRATVPLPALSAGSHVLRIRAVDPGAVVDRVSFPTAN